MGKSFSRAGTFIAGAVAVVVIVVLLMAFGVVPVKTETTTLVRYRWHDHDRSVDGIVDERWADGGADLPELRDGCRRGALDVQPARLQPVGQQSSGQALGSGFVVSKDGYILTNAHVVVNNGQKATSVEVVFKGQGQDGGTHVDCDGRRRG